VVVVEIVGPAVKKVCRWLAARKSGVVLIKNPLKPNCESADDIRPIISPGVRKRSSSSIRSNASFE
jgi:hypothetical protein